MKSILEGERRCLLCYDCLARSKNVPTSEHRRAGLVIREMMFTTGRPAIAVVMVESRRRRRLRDVDILFHADGDHIRIFEAHNMVMIAREEEVRGATISVKHLDEAKDLTAEQFELLRLGTFRGPDAYTRGEGHGVSKD